MITVTVQRNAHCEIEEIAISGHANAGRHGEDIVCAAVSAVSLGIVNSIQPLLGFVPDVEHAAEEGGFLRWRVGRLDDARLHEKQQLLAESMVVALFVVAETNGKYVAIHDSKWQGGA
ncbi:MULTISPECIES: ribosomal-processing cysteine protease Prp [Bacillales]|jgi:uncharacterized protein YsxB (DUF464 family)|uniref:Ribosomal processing cysteine protease Prp n=1 Tax=Brevibacillus aydinogluensis TaxID=927786 RepID=A0AA48M8W0_9BACL|nr:MULTISPECIES: ribosomal-processing cysteine protease Prp [Bacillales]REK64509.1 MAG: ribosomal-processing cysteine protease Prp [Brevibacillus sp.]MBR8660598.1 ribosomal-processing cysteine protease Prp [Brevibacillus sp. NL20B1]MDT3414378.1 uncharacterized protein YsxB (DUF464 family) [Brevibacillus aydinogluensis]NNV02606.1 ribosomal-processing cysteine protease Prp [Brevibacillus sp. MCWH]UFJ59967.1 ribosomal-processing cysteine protease Prp [Anoxybacillus sediminis]